jgi:alkanesulfonate monooxygenase SsuD/methylene tetrahydromethanopterin reductase-like flavin-dependent oxidoreductase (luciferase family)
MLGIDTDVTRTRLSEALGVILRLLLDDEPVDHEGEWFTLRNAKLQLRPVQRPTVPISVAATVSPAGPRTAGTHGVGMLSLSQYLPNKEMSTADQWVIASEAAALAGKEPHARSIEFREADALALPFPDESFDALWTMSTFVHVPDERFDAAMAALLRVVSPGAPLGIGTWGGRDFEGITEFGALRPYRYFSLATHERWRSMLARHGDVQHFETFAPEQPGGWEYQYAVVRRRG